MLGPWLWCGCARVSHTNAWGVCAKWLQVNQLSQDFFNIGRSGAIFNPVIIGGILVQTFLG